MELPTESNSDEASFKLTKSSLKVSVTDTNPYGTIKRQRIWLIVDKDLFIRSVEPNAVGDKLGTGRRRRGAGRKRGWNQDDRNYTLETHLTNRTVDDNLAWRRVEANLMWSTLQSEG